MGRRMRGGVTTLAPHTRAKCRRGSHERRESSLRGSVLPKGGWVEFGCGLLPG